MTRDIEIDLSRPVSLAETPGLFAAFVSWWGGELAALLPDRWRMRYSTLTKRRALYVSAGDEAARPFGFTVEAADEGSETGLASAAEPVDVWIDPALVLRRTLTLPNLPAPQIRSAIALQIDELTPFEAHDVLFDYRVVTRDAAAPKMEVAAAFLPNRILTAILEKAGLSRTQIGTLGVRSTSDDASEFEFALNETPKSLRNSVVSGFVAIAIVVAGPWFVSWAWDYAGARERQGLEAQIQALRPQAEVARQANAQLRAFDAPMAALSERKGPDAALGVLAALSEINPQTVTIVKLDVENGMVQLTGLARSASAYLEMLEKSLAFEGVTFSAPVSAGQAEGMERFSMTLKISGGRP